jgi:hypothetical protein
MTATIPSFEEYTRARYVLAHPRDFDTDDLAGAALWIEEFESAVRQSVAERFGLSSAHGLLPTWVDMAPWMRDALFDAAMVGACTAQGGAR